MHYQHVAYDYAVQLAAGVTAADVVVASMLSAALTSSTATPGPSLQSCHLLNSSLCDAMRLGGDGHAVVAFNPLPRSRSAAVRVPWYGAGNASVTVTDASGDAIPAAVLTNTLPGTGVSCRGGGVENLVTKCLFLAKVLVMDQCWQWQAA